MSPRQRRVYELMQHRLGFLRAARTMAFIMEWGIFTAEVGRPPENIEEFVDWWEGGVSRATAYRLLSDFREVFGEWGIEYPTGLFAVLGVDPGNFSVSDLLQRANLETR